MNNNNKNRCLYCYQLIEDESRDFHESCSRKIFRQPDPPHLDLDLKQLEDLAKEIIIKSVAVTGVQPKLSLEIEKISKSNSRLTIVGLYGDFILKPPSTEYAELPQNEDVTMHLAALSGIKTAQHCLIKLASGELAYLTKRFDRKKKEKIHVEDLCQLTETLTEHKYRGSIEKTGKTIYKYSANKGLEMQRYFELVLFSYLTGNADMHLKNYSLMENEFGEFELSPAYDLVSTALVIPDDKEESALTLNGKKNRILLKDFDALAQSLNINEKVLLNIYTRFTSLQTIWIEFIKNSFLSDAMQNRYIELINERGTRLFKN